ncbi:MAG: hypothetical protein E7660_04440 [Ruminococcaceae bacterium]|nr:hypothetical protein [Oscillospiraceae bacterium]
MNFKRILSVFLALLFTFGIIGEAVSVNAAYADKVDAEGNPVINYYTEVYKSDNEKLGDMVMFKEQNGYKIYVEEFTGEIAFVDSKTGNAIFSNPYDLAGEGNVQSNATKQTILSQILLTYEDNGVQKNMTSYKDAALRGQIKTKNIKNGVRMEYTIGEIMVTRLVPRRISKERFETLILEKITSEFHLNRLKAFYQLYDRNDTRLTETLVKEMEAAFPITKRMAIYVCSTEITSTELKQLESIIKTYCPLYTYDEMDQDHNETDYVGVDVAPPCFRMALEYTVSDKGELDVRLPANGIRFDESVYSLGDVSVLPYMGAGNVDYEGYTFIPDGSGSIIRFEDVAGINSTISGKVYGPDFAYHTVTGQHEQTMRYPIFGNVVNVAGQEGEDGATIAGKNTGYVAIITEGDSMAQIIAENGGPIHNYSTVYAKFTPRPSDTYNLADSLAIGSNASWTVVSKRKYSGSYKIKYILLSDKEVEGKTNYECSYVGMAKAYRDYLMDAGVLTKLSADQISENVPLYVETFGSIETVDRLLSFPVTVDTPLTTFENVQTMYNELSEAGVSNINFRLTGFSNGGLDSTYPSKISWVKALGGNGGFNDLLDYSVEKGFGVYPDFDFAYVADTEYFDGLNEKKDAVKTIDSRYTSRKYYDSATQSLEDDFAKAISPSRFEYFCEKFAAEYAGYNTQKVSVSTLGDTLNSDFDKKEPYNREDSKQFTVEMLDSLSQSFSDVMVNGGNIYSVQYADHILGVSTDSSNYKRASQSVPFTGFLLHGFKNYAGQAINMEGDIEYSILKTIENGASLYFTLSYDNINVLKESETYNKYYSVDFNVWKDEVADNYAVVNEALKDIQTALMTDHEFISGYRVPTEADLAADQAEADKKNAEAEKAAKEQAEKDKLAQLLADRKGTTATSSGNKTAPKATVTTKTTADGTVYCTNDKYVTDLGSIVKVEYDNGTAFYINYNSYDVVISDGNAETVIKALSFEKIN